MTTNDPDILWQLDNRMDSISERISVIEGELKERNQKSILQRVSEIGGLMALFISLLLGGFTLHEEFVVKPEIRQQKQAEQIREAISELSKIQGDLLSIDWKNDPAAQAKLGAYAPRRFSLLEKITALPAEHTEKLTFADFILLVRELAQFGRVEDAKKYLQLAENTADDAPQKAAVDLMRGRFAALDNDPDSFNKYFQKAVDIYLSQGLKLAANELLSTYVEWIGYSLSNNSCDHATKENQAFRNFLNHNDVWPLVRAQAVRLFNDMLSSQKTDCGLKKIT